jgi:hypothetical protein
MDVKEATVLSFTLWALICFLIAKSFEIFITLLLIGTLVIYELGRNYIPKRAKELVEPAIYLMLLSFAIIVVKKVMEVLK